MDIKHLLSRNPLKPAFQGQSPLTPIRASVAKWVGFEGGLGVCAAELLKSSSSGAWMLLVDADQLPTLSA